MGALAWLFARRPGVLGVAALAALPFRMPVQSGGSTANLLVPLYVVIGAGAVAWLVPRLAARHAGATPAERSGALEWVLLGGIVLYALQAVYADDSAKALEQVVFFYVPFALLFALLRGLEWTPRQLAWGGGVLVVLALVFTAVGFWEFQTRSLLLNPKVIASNQVEEYFRVNSLFFDPNIYGRFLALVMIGLASVLLWARARAIWRWTIVALAILWGGLVTTLSQSSFAALLLGLAVLAWLRFGGKVVVVPALAAIVAARGDRVRVPGALRLDLGDSKSLDNATSGPRRPDARRRGPRAREAAARLGVGQLQRRVPPRTSTAPSREATSASHTIPITVAAEQGIIGLAAYVALLVLAFIRLLRGARGVSRAGGDRRRLRRAGAAHVALRRLPRGSGDVDAARARHRPGAPGVARARRPRRTRRRRSTAIAASRWSWRARCREAEPLRAAGRERRAAALAAGVAVLVWALTRTYPNYDSYYHLVWGRQLLDGLEPSFTAYAAPTQHPLYVALGALLGLVFGESADRALVLVCLLSHAALVFGTYRLGAAVFGRWSGALARAVRRRQRVVPALRGARLRRRAVPGARRLGRRAGGRGPRPGRPLALLVAAGPAAPGGVGAGRSRYGSGTLPRSRHRVWLTLGAWSPRRSIWALVGLSSPAIRCTPCTRRPSSPTTSAACAGWSTCPARSCRSSGPPCARRSRCWRRSARVLACGCSAGRRCACRWRCSRRA